MDFRPNQELLLDIDESKYWRVYSLTKRFEENPSYPEDVRALTLNKAKPQFGLKGTFGLFGSAEWWDSINHRRMPLRFVAGVIVGVSEAGQDSLTGVNNTMVLKDAAGTEEQFGIYVNNRKDAKLFRVGCTVRMVFALDELKRPRPDVYSPTALEVAVSRMENSGEAGSSA